MSMYYVVIPRWVRVLRAICDRIKRWTVRFELMYPMLADGSIDYSKPQRF